MTRRNAVYLDVHTTTNTGLAYLADIDPSRLAGIMVPTEYSANLVRARFRKSASIHVVPNILETQRFTPVSMSARGDSFVREGSAPREFVWVGKLDHHKNWRLALVYAAMFQELFGDVRLHLVGGFTAPESQAQAFFELAFRLGISNAVNWLDRVDNRALVEIYRKCAATGGAMLVTSRDESFGMAAAEALLCGCPLITNDLPVFREVFPDSPLMHRVDIWQPDQVAAAAAAIIQKPAEADVIALHRRLSQKFGPKAFVDKFKRLFVV